MPTVEESDAASGTDTAELEARLARYPARRYPAQYAAAAFHLGTAQLQRRRVSEALSNLRAAHDVFGRLGMRLEQAKALTMHGVALREAGRSDLARQSFERAVTVFVELGQPVEEAAASYDLGLTLQDEGDGPSARQALSRARGLFLAAGYLAQAGAAAREEGASLLASGRFEAARALLQEATSLAERGGDLPGLGAAANALGLAQLASDDAPAAALTFSSAVGAYPRSLRPAEHAMAKANLALAHERAGSPARSRLAARQALAVHGVDPTVRAQAQEILDRLIEEAQLDLLVVLDAEPLEQWPSIIRDEALRWCDAATSERLVAVRGFLDGLLARPGTSYDLAESLLAVVLELPPQQYGTLVTAIVQGTGQLDATDGERVRAVVGSALARFAIPQWQRLASSLNTAAAAAGEPAGWR
ncbi:MAG: tetratricopeptide repeat protein [Mycobacteriales bacterium]